MLRSSRTHPRRFSARMPTVVAAVFALVAVLLAPSAPALAAGSSITPMNDAVQVGETLVVDHAADEPDEVAVVEAPEEAAEATLTLSSAELAGGDTLSVDYTTPTAGALNWIGIYRDADGYPDGSPGSLLWAYAPETSGSLDFTLDAGTFVPGEYLVYFLADDGYSAVTAAEPFIVGAGTASLNALSLIASSILPGDEISIEYVVADPKPLNWVGIYAADETPGVDDARAYQYVADAKGTLRWDGTNTGSWIGQGATPPGEYEVFLFEDDGYTVLAGPEALTIEAAPVPEPRPQTGGTADLRVLTWNIYQGGRSTGDDDLVNQQHAAEYIASLEPDVFAAIETYGASETILAALNDNDAGHVYTGTRITQRSNDNLWIFSRLPIVEVIPAPEGFSVDDFNLGAVRVRLDNNREVTVYDVWSNYTDPWIGDLIEENAQDVQAGDPARHSEDEIIAADRIQTASIADFIAFAEQHSPGAHDVAIIGGDLNTISSEDWGAGWASCPRHYGLSYDLVATRQFADAGYTDTYRADNPDACAAPGVTWSPRLTMDTPDRIDLSYVRGAGASVADAVILDDRLPAHGDGEFYSDHAALLVDYEVASIGGGTVPGGDQGADPGSTEPSGELAATGSAAPVVSLLAGVAALIAGALLAALRRRGTSGDA